MDQELNTPLLFGNRSNPDQALPEQSHRETSSRKRGEGPKGLIRNKMWNGPDSERFVSYVLSTLKGDFLRLFSKIRLVKKRLIFIGSSTFTDTHDIRNYFMEKHLPLMIELGQLHDIDVIYIDMRYCCNTLFKPSCLVINYLLSCFLKLHKMGRDGQEYDGTPNLASLP